MSDAIATYLEKRADLESHTLESPDPPEELQTVIVIPALAEESTLPDTLESLSQCNTDLLPKTLVVIVVNNHSPDNIDPEIIAENQRTLAWLKTDPYPDLHLATIDASSPGLELKKNEGVGSARKIGMDHALNLLHEADPRSPLIVCLDADTVVRATYLDSLNTFAKSENPWASVMNYAHSMPEDPTERAAIIAYELFLRYQALALNYAGSPYAFHTIGSTIACTPRAYAAVSGMNKRKAGEDFYFLQQLAKTGTVTAIESTIVVPSPRNSWRVPFGTGKRVQRFIDETHDEYRVYNFHSYKILREWLKLIPENLDASGESILQQAAEIHHELEAFLKNLDFVRKWDKIQANTKDPEQALKQFHCLFDGFQTLKFIHHLRDSFAFDQRTFVAYAELFAALYINMFIRPGIQEDVPEQFGFLNALRKIMRNSEV